MIQNQSVTVTVRVDMSTIVTEGASLDKVIDLITKALANRPPERDESGPLYGTWRPKIVSGMVEAR